MGDPLARLRQRIDAQFQQALYGTTTVAASQPQEPLTLDKLQRMMASLPKPDIFLSTCLFPAHDSAMKVEGGKARYMVAHPNFWQRAEYEIRRMNAANPPPLHNNPLGGLWSIRIEEIDAQETDTQYRTDYIASLWKDLREAVEVAMVVLPEWLRPSPAFGAHG